MRQVILSLTGLVLLALAQEASASPWTSCAGQHSRVSRSFRSTGSHWCSHSRYCRTNSSHTWHGTYGQRSFCRPYCSRGYRCYHGSRSWCYRTCGYRSCSPRTCGCRIYWRPYCVRTYYRPEVCRTVCSQLSCTRTFHRSYHYRAGVCR